MIIFLFSSILTFCLAKAILHLDRSEAAQSGEIKIKLGSFELQIGRKILASGTFIILLLLAGLATYLAIVQVIKPSNGLYSAYDIVTGPLLNRLTFGVLFGFLSAIWLNRIYRKTIAPDKKEDTYGPELPTVTKRKTVTEIDKHGNSKRIVTDTLRDQKDKNNAGATTPTLTFIEKMEGVVLIVLFILGTTTFSIEDLVSGVAVDSPVVKFQLQNQTQSALNQKDRFFDSSDIQESSQQKSADVLNPYFLANIARFVEADANYAALYGDCDTKFISTASACEEIRALKKVEKMLAKLMTFNACLASNSHNYIDGERSFFRRKVKQLLPIVAKVHASVSKPAALKRTYNRFRLKAFELSRPLVSHHKIFNGGLGLCKELDRLLKNDPSHPRDLKNGKHSADFLNYDLESGIKERPYFAIIYATLLALDKQYPVAVGVMQKWIHEFSQNSKRKNDIKSVDFWLIFRAIGIQSKIYENWARDSETQTFSPTVLAEHVSLMRRYIEIFHKIRVIENRKKYFGAGIFDDVPGRTLEAIGFLRKLPSRECALNIKKETDEQKKHDARLKLNLLVAYYSTISVFIFRGLDDPRYENDLAPEIDGRLSELVNASDACFKVYAEIVRNPNLVTTAIAENYRIYGMAQLQKIRFKRSIGDNYENWIRKKLEVSINAFRLASSDVADLADSERKIREKFNDHRRFSISHAEWLKEDLSTRIDALENVLEKRK